MGLEILVIMVIVVAAIIITVLSIGAEITLADRMVGQASSLGTRLARRKAGDVGSSGC